MPFLPGQSGNPAGRKRGVRTGAAPIWRLAHDRDQNPWYLEEPRLEAGLDEAEKREPLGKQQGDR